MPGSQRASGGQRWLDNPIQTQKSEALEPGANVVVDEGQLKQAEEPLIGWKVPIGHSMQGMVPVDELDPSMHNAETSDSQTGRPNLCNPRLMTHRHSGSWCCLGTVGKTFELHRCRNHGHTQRTVRRLCRTQSQQGSVLRLLRKDWMQGTSALIEAGGPKNEGGLSARTWLTSSLTGLVLVLSSVAQGAWLQASGGE